MKIVDTNGLDYMTKNGVAFKGPLLITPDVREEYETWHEKRLPENVVEVFEEDWFDSAGYLQCYQRMLNKYGGKSFYNMTGFGDISILSFLGMQQMASASVLPGLHEQIEVITSDGPLSNKIRREFCSGSDAFGASLKITKAEDFF